MSRQPGPLDVPVLGSALGGFLVKPGSFAPQADHTHGVALEVSCPLFAAGDLFKTISTGLLLCFASLKTVKCQHKGKQFPEDICA